MFWGLSGSPRQTTRVSDPTLAREWACRADAQGWVSQQDRASLCSQAWPWSSSVAWKAQGKKRRRGNEKLVAQVLCHWGWARVARGPAQGTSLHWRVAQRRQDLADGFSSGSGKLATKSPDMLLDLLGPFHVVRSRLLTRQALDEVLQAPPEAYNL